MKRKSIIFAILCVLMLVSGCSSQSADDIYQMMGNASSKSNGSESSGQSDMVSDNSPRVYTEDYKECNKNYMPELVQTGETAKVTLVVEMIRYHLQLQMPLLQMILVI